MTSHSPRASGVGDLRLASPVQLALIGAAVWLLGALLHPLAILAAIGLLLLAVAAVGYLLRPRTQTMYWRGRRIELDNKTSTRHRLYYSIFRS